MTQEDAVAALAALLRSQTMRPESLFAIVSAAHAIETEGISGTLIIKVPRKYGPVDVQFTTGPSRISLET